MRITFVMPGADLSGGNRVVAVYADRLKRRGHDVLVVYPPPRQPTLGQRLRSVIKEHAWLGQAKQGPSHLAGYDVPRRALNQRRPVLDGDVPAADVVIATWWETAEWVARLTPSKGAKAHFIQHDERHMRECNRSRVAATWRLPMHRITIAQWLMDLARNEFGDKHASLVLNSVDTQQFYAPRRGKQIVPTVGMLYSTVRFKGCEVSIKAFEKARLEWPDLRLVAYGAEPVSETLPLPEGSTYFMKPPQSQIRDVYSHCDVWLCGSRSEGFHLPPLEAMACRCPVVGTRVGGVSEIIDHGRNGYCVDVGDADALANGLALVLRTDDTGWRYMSDAAYARAAGYTWDDATVLFEKALEHAVERAGRGEIAGGVREIVHG